MRNADVAGVGLKNRGTELLVFVHSPVYREATLHRGG